VLPVNELGAMKAAYNLLAQNIMIIINHQTCFFTILTFSIFWIIFLFDIFMLLDKGNLNFLSLDSTFVILTNVRVYDCYAFYN